MKTILTMISAGLLFFATSCEKSSTQDDMRPADNAPTSIGGASSDDKAGTLTATNDRNTSIGTAVDMNFITQMTVYFDAVQFRVLAKPSAPKGDVFLSPSIAALPITINKLYVIQDIAAGGTITRFLPVIDMLPESQFNSRVLWQQVNIVFLDAAARPFQLTSGPQIVKMLQAPNPDIVASETNSFFELQMSLKDQPAAIQ
jgi:hypothetical protein